MTDESMEIATRPVAGPMPLLTDDEIKRTWRLAQGLSASGMFKDARQAEQAFAKILLGRDLGLSPTQAMTGIHIVEGKPTVAAVTLAAFVRKTPGYDYKVRELTRQRCEIEFFLNDESVGLSEFTMEDAATAKLVKPGSGWEKNPRNMLFARALSNGVRWFAPDATHGISVYHEGEIPEPLSLTRPGERPVEIDFGEDEDMALNLKQACDILGYKHAKIRALMRGAGTPELRKALLTELEGEIDKLSVGPEEVVDATDVAA